MGFRSASQPGIMQRGARWCSPGTPNISAQSFYGFPSHVSWTLDTPKDANIL
jgi:hypothetical protein